MKHNKRKILGWSILLMISLITSGCGQKNKTSAVEQVVTETTPIIVQNEDFSVIFINAGKADAALVQVENKDYLIDTGKKESVDAIKAALESQEVTQLDGVFLTHIHGDHIGGLKKLSKVYPIQKVYSAEISMNDTNGTNRIDSLVTELGLNQTKLVASDKVQITDQVAFEVLGPITYDPNDDNDNSLVLRLSINNKVFLFAGDMQFAEEKSLLFDGVDLKADVLKVGNHGNPDATSADFARAVSPEIAVISTDTSVKKNSASKRVQELFQESQLYLTQDFNLGIKITISEEGKLVVSNP